MIDLSKYFVTSLTEDAYISTVVNLNYAPWQAESGRNEVFAGSVLSSYDIVAVGMDEDYNPVKNYLPETALDGENLQILASSDESVCAYGFNEETWQEGWIVNLA